MEYEYNTLDADDVKFKHPFSMLISGGRRTGKTHFTKTLLLRNNEFITPKVDRIFWFYASYQPIAFDEIKENVANVEFVRGLPEEDILDTIQKHYGRKLVIIDDLMEEASNRSDVKHLFTRGRHEDVSVIFLVQNLYHKAKHSREISLNTDYLVVFKNPRDLTPIINIGRQMNKPELSKAYKDATTKPFSYILADLRADTREELQFRSGVFDEFPISYV